MKGGESDEDLDIWKIRIQLTKPVTWIPLIWGVLCGAAASGKHQGDTTTATTTTTNNKPLQRPMLDDLNPLPPLQAVSSGALEMWLCRY